MQNAVAWNPDSRASLALAATMLMLVMAGFAALFSVAPKLKLFQDTERNPERLVLAEPMPVSPAPRHRVLTPLPPMPLLQGSRPTLLAPMVLPHPITSQ